MEILLAGALFSPPFERPENELVFSDPLVSYWDILYGIQYSSYPATIG